ncbi:uncharacterized protein LOC124163273 isoform X2 [Ischnura elegans]|uniref:uncharacterized protein LOC124163273 isoform X2 n=1 Tax=Ischnura elegans TaxID=197161 RepID=UPI001ED89278|nr:uncharacterized protein LOC124163273 isoform X2 [Ischnura elegans]
MNGRTTPDKHSPSKDPLVRTSSAGGPTPLPARPCERRGATPVECRRSLAPATSLPRRRRVGPFFGFHFASRSEGSSRRVSRRSIRCGSLFGRRTHRIRCRRFAVGSLEDLAERTDCAMAPVHHHLRIACGDGVFFLLVRTTLVVLLCCAVTLKAQDEELRLNPIPAEYRTEWNDSREGTPLEVEIYPTSADDSPAVTLPPPMKPSETAPVTLPPSIPPTPPTAIPSSSLPYTVQQPHSADIKESKETEEARSKRRHGNLLDPGLFLNFSLTLGHVPDPNSSVYQTIHDPTREPDNSINTENDGEVSVKATDHPPKDATGGSTAAPPTAPRVTTERPSEERRHPCHRECIAGEPPMVCRYFFVQEWYETMSKACYACPLDRSHCDLEHCIAADGVQRTIVVVNRTMPGPAIQVCLGDEVEVVLENAMPEEGASLHWHGLHQRGSPHMDGVPFVTQCPITPGASFVYRFNASSPGTHFWHSHSGLQRGDGSYGALIIRTPKEQDPHTALYDTDLEDHIMQITDWSHHLGVVTFVSHHHGDGDNKPPSILVNGKGRFRPFPSSAATTGRRSGPSFLPFPVEAGVRNQVPNTTYTPVAVFKVQRGIRHRFRLINSGFLNCPIQLSIDNHTLLVLSSDGGDVKPVMVDSLVSYAGERFDFILVPEWQTKQRGNEEQIGVKRFWARFRGLMDCDERFTRAHQVAIIEYIDEHEISESVDVKLLKDVEPLGDVSYEAADRKGLTLNALNVGAGAEGSHSAAELEAIGMATPTADDPLLKPKADFTFYLGYDFYGKDNPIYHIPELYGFHKVLDDRQRLQTPQLNHISLKMPHFPLLTQRNLLDDDSIDPPEFCNATSMAAEGKQCSKQDFCHCTHLLRVPTGAVVELILIDEGVAYDANHPFHLHGHAFRVIGMGRVGKSVTVETIKALDSLGYIHRRTKPYKPALKDTVTVPDGGYTVVRFHATNPGYWLFHCHLGFHVELGMALIFKVGEHGEFAPVPHNFPKCGNWAPLDVDEFPIHEEPPKTTKIPNKFKNLVEEPDLTPEKRSSTSSSSSTMSSHHWTPILLLLIYIFNTNHRPH